MLILLGFIFAIFMIAVVGSFSGSLGVVIDIPSLLIILVPLLFFLCVSKSGGIIWRYILSVIKKDNLQSKDELKILAHATKSAVKFTLAMGIFGFMSGIIFALGNLDSPEHLGPNIAVSLITVLYAIAISSFVFFPTQIWAEHMIKKEQ
jgi:flagellar motor component MotA